jgi:hypothetical protein
LTVFFQLLWMCKIIGRQIKKRRKKC